MFQPGEEGHAGARFMLDEGLLDGAAACRRRQRLAGDRRVRDAHHVVDARRLRRAPAPGRCMASSDTLRIVVTGRGGHASEPFRALDPIPVACEIVQALQTMVTRRIDVFDPAIVTVGEDRRRHHDERHPRDRRDPGHDPRRVSEKTRARVHDGIRRVAEGVAAAHEAEVEVEITYGYPVTVNADDFAEFSMGVAGGRPRRGPRAPPAEPGDGRRGLQLRDRAGARGDDVPRRHAARPSTRPPPRRTTRTAWSSTSRRWSTGVATYAAVALRHLGLP